MDPKMDSGCVQPGEELDVLYDVSRSLQPEEVLGIMDQLICHEVSVTEHSRLDDDDASWILACHTKTEKRKKRISKKKKIINRANSP